MLFGSVQSLGSPPAAQVPKQAVQRESAAKPKDTLNGAIGLRLAIRGQGLLHFFQQIVEHRRQRSVETTQALCRFGCVLSLLGLGKGEVTFLH